MGTKTLILLFCGVVWVKGHEYDSSTESDGLKAREDDIVNSFIAYIKSEEEYLNTLKKVLQVLYINQLTDLKTSEPLMVYQGMQRLRVQWATICEFTKQSLFQGYQDILKSLVHDLPTQEDADDAGLGIIMLQEMYKLYPQNLTANPQTGISHHLRWDLSCHLGRVAYSHGRYQHAFLWFRESLTKLLESQEKDADSYKKILLGNLSLSAYEFGDLPSAVHYAKQRVSVDPTDLQSSLDLANYRSKLSEHTSSPNILVLNETSSSTYQALCRGEEVKTKSRTKGQLTCRYSTSGGNPRLMYAPAKEEEVWDKPPIITYHDFISEREIEQLKSLSRLKWSEDTSKDGVERVSLDRLSEIVWLNDEDAPLVSHISQRLSDITGLGMESAEPLQMVSYGLGGHFIPHYDTTEEYSDNPDGNRVATIMIYLSDVSYGGSTVFPKIGASVKPQKGSMVMWYNLLHNGQEDNRSLYGGCPFLDGSTWVAVKWIHERGQEFRRRCSLSEME